MNRRHHTSTKGTRVSKPSHARHVSQLLAIAFGLLASLVLGVAFASAAAPTVTIEPASEVGFTTAHVSGTVDPEGSSPVRGVTA
jgi:hypothetical protein